MVIEDIRAGRHPEIPIDIEVPYEEHRREYALEVYNMMIEMPLLQDD